MLGGDGWGRNSSQVQNRTYTTNNVMSIGSTTQSGDWFNATRIACLPRTRPGSRALPLLHRVVCYPGGRTCDAVGFWPCWTQLREARRLRDRNGRAPSRVASPEIDLLELYPPMVYWGGRLGQVRGVQRMVDDDRYC